MLSVLVSCFYVLGGCECIGMDDVCMRVRRARGRVIERLILLINHCPSPVFHSMGGCCVIVIVIVWVARVVIVVLVCGARFVLTFPLLLCGRHSSSHIHSRLSFFPPDLPL